MAKKKGSASSKYQLNEQDLKKVARNAAIFFAPAALLILVNLQNGATVEQIANIVYLWLLNALVDLLRKFMAGAK